MDHILQLYFETHEIDTLIDGRKMGKKCGKGGGKDPAAKMFHQWMKKPHAASNRGSVSPGCSTSKDTDNESDDLSLTLM